MLDSLHKDYQNGHRLARRKLASFDTLGKYKKLNEYHVHTQAEYDLRNAHLNAKFAVWSTGPRGGVVRGGGAASMGTYLGGSTILRFGRFTTKDPAENLCESVSRKKRSRTGAANSSNAQKKKGKDPRTTLDCARNSLLHYVIDRILANKNEFKIPRNLHPELRIEISNAGSLEQWAKTQTGFENIKSKKSMKKKNSKHKLSKPATPKWKPAKMSNSKRSKIQRKRERLAEEHAGVVAARGISGSKKQPKKRSRVQISGSKLPRPKKLTKRSEILNALVDFELNLYAGRSVENLRIDTNRLDAMNKVGGPLVWAKAQPEYPYVFELRSRKLGQKHESLESEPPREDSSCFTERDFIARGKERVKIHIEQPAGNWLDALIFHVGMLPHRPRSRNGKRFNWHNPKSEVRKAWESSMNSAQLRAWNELDAKQQQEYLSMGIVNVGKPPNAHNSNKSSTLGDASPSEIINMIKKTDTEKMDIHKIDWDVT